MRRGQAGFMAALKPEGPHEHGANARSYFLMCFWLALFSVRSSFAANIVFQSFVTWINTRPSNLVGGISENDSKQNPYILR